MRGAKRRQESLAKKGIMPAMALPPGVVADPSAESPAIVEQRAKIRELVKRYEGVDTLGRGLLLAILLQEAGEPEAAAVLYQKYQLATLKLKA
jgi:hypothetical protein